MLQMTEKEMKKLNTIKKILGGECTKKEAVESLGITTRQIDRLILKYKNDGDAGFIHKSRGKESKLNKLLDQIILPSLHVRRLALTATPIELEAGQWTQMLERIGVEAGGQLSVAVADYMQAVAAVRLHPGEQRYRFRQAARAFHNALGPYLLRRDKRQESSIRAFAEFSGEELHAYRREEPVRIDVSRLSRPSFCIASVELYRCVTLTAASLASSVFFVSIT